MRAVASSLPRPLPLLLQGAAPVGVTLLELVNAICEVTEDDDEVIATVIHMIRSGRAKLCGNFSGATARDLS